MNEIKLAKQCMELIRKDLSLEESLSLSENTDPLRQLREALIHQLNILLDKDFTKLINGMYRIDISEEQVSRILETSKPGKISENLADAIIDREILKVKTREKYSK